MRRTKLAALRYHRCFALASRRCASAGRHANGVRVTTLRANGRNPAGSRSCNSRCGFRGFAPTTPSLPGLPHCYWVFVQRLLFISLLCVDYMRSSAHGQGDSQAHANPAQARTLARCSGFCIPGARRGAGRRSRPAACSCRNRAREHQPGCGA
jgi:hypothetical protein